MALKPKIYKSRITLSDTDRHYYDALNLTIAQHPSESLERMMAWVLAFCIYARDSPVFTRGLCVVDEPDLWVRGPDEHIVLWVDVGEPAIGRIKKATRLCFRAGRGRKAQSARMRAAPPSFLGASAFCRTVKDSGLPESWTVSLAHFKSGLSCRLPRCVRPIPLGAEARLLSRGFSPCLCRSVAESAAVFLRYSCVNSPAAAAAPAAACASRGA